MKVTLFITIKRSLNAPSPLKRVATLPREMYSKYSKLAPTAVMAT